MGVFEHIGVGLVFAGAALLGGYMSGSLMAAVPIAITAFMLGFHNNYSLSQIIQKIEAYANGTNTATQKATANATYQPVTSQAASNGTITVPITSVTAASEASVPSMSDIPAEYGVQIGTAVVATPNNAAKQILGNGVTVYDVPIGSIIRKTNLGWYIVDTYKGAVYTRINPLSSDSYFGA